MLSLLKRRLLQQNFCQFLIQHSSLFVFVLPLRTFSVLNMDYGDHVSRCRHAATLAGLTGFTRTVS